MADLPKLASTFKAWRLKFSVELFIDYGEVLERCKKMGLNPDVKGWDEKSRMYVHVVLPRGPEVGGESDINVAAFWKVMEGTTARHEHWTEVELICPAIGP